MATEKIKNTRAKVFLSASHIHQMLDLPENLQVLTIGASFDPPGAYVVVHGDHLREVPEDCELPLMPGALTEERIVVNGKVYSRWSWSKVDYDEVSKAANAFWTVR